MRPNQPIYCAAPAYLDGLQDPLPERMGLLDGTLERVPVPVDLAPRPRATRERVATVVPAFSAEGLGLLPSPGLDAALERLSAGAVRDVLLRGIFAYINDVGRERVDVAALAEALAAAAAPYRAPGEIAAYNLESMIGWCLGQVPPEPAPPTPHYPARGLPAAEAAARLRAEVAAFLERATAWHAAPDTPPPVVGIKAAAGLGKTEATIRALAAIPGVEAMHVEYYVPGHKLGAELVARLRARGLRVLIIRGRGSVDLDGEPMCQKAELADELGRAGLNVGRHLCRSDEGIVTESCQHFATCRYQQRMRDREPAIRVLAHAALFTPRPQELPKPDLIMIDESFWPHGIRHQQLALDRLSEAGRWRVRPRKGEPKTILEGRKLEAEDAALRVQAALRDGRDPRSVVTAEECRAVAAIEWGSLAGPDISPGMPLSIQRHRWASWKRCEAGKAGRFWNLLEEECGRRERPIQRIVLERDAPTKGGDRRHLLHLHHRRPLKLPTAPILLLDADLDARIARKFLSTIEVVDIAVRQNARVVQVADRTCSMRFLLGGETATRAGQTGATSCNGS